MDRHLRDLLEAAVGEPPHRVSAAVVHRRVIRRRVVEFAVAAVAVVAIAVLIPLGIRALDQGPGPETPRPTPAPTFTSREYGYTVALPPGWRSNGPARLRWDGKGAPADFAPVSDLFDGPDGVEVFVIAAPTTENLTAYTATTIRADHAIHHCSAPQTRQAITIGGAPAQLLTMQCVAGSGSLVETAVTIHAGTAFVFTVQNPAGAIANHRADRAAFRNFLAGIRLRR